MEESTLLVIQLKGCTIFKYKLTHELQNTGDFIIDIPKRTEQSQNNLETTAT